MTTTYDSFTASSQVFVPRGMNASQTHHCAQSFTSEMQKADSFSSQTTGCYYNNSNMHVAHNH